MFPDEKNYYGFSKMTVVKVRVAIMSTQEQEEDVGESQQSSFAVERRPCLLCDSKQHLPRTS